MIYNIIRKIKNFYLSVDNWNMKCYTRDNKNINKDCDKHAKEN